MLLDRQVTQKKNNQSPLQGRAPPAAGEAPTNPSKVAIEGPRVMEADSPPKAEAKNGQRARERPEDHRADGDGCDAPVHLLNVGVAAVTPEEGVGKAAKDVGV